METFTYYPGCTLRTKAKDLDTYARKSAEALGIALEEPADWQCCGGAYTTAILTIPAVVRQNVYYMNGILPALENAVVPIPVAIILSLVVYGTLYKVSGHPLTKYTPSLSSVPIASNVII